MTSFPYCYYRISLFPILLMALISEQIGRSVFSQFLVVSVKIVTFAVSLMIQNLLNTYIPI